MSGTVVVRDIAQGAGGWALHADGSTGPAPVDALAHGWGCRYAEGAMAVVADEGSLWLQLPGRRLDADAIGAVWLLKEQARRAVYRLDLVDGTTETVTVRFRGRVAFQRAVDPLYDEFVSSEHDLMKLLPYRVPGEDPRPLDEWASSALPAWSAGFALAEGDP